MTHRDFGDLPATLNRLVSNENDLTKEKQL